MERIRLGIVLLFCACSASASTALGDWGHYLRYAPKIHLQNPDGRAFRLTLHLLRMPIEAWNAKQVMLKLSAPDGSAIIDGKVDISGDSKVLEVPAGPKGTYFFEMNLPAKHPLGGPDFWIEDRQSLRQISVYDDDPVNMQFNAPEGRRCMAVADALLPVSRPRRSGRR